jgi:succinoglycan biosynthesis protein ExoA
VQTDHPLVTVIMPVRNEALTIQKALDSIRAQTYPVEKIEIIVVDANSTDETSEIVRERMLCDNRILLLIAQCNCPAAMNLGIHHSRGTIVVKMDGHGYMEAGFIDTGVRYLLENPDCSCVGGQIIPLGTSRVSSANMHARFSWFGVGPGIYTVRPTIRKVDTVQCGAYVKNHLLKVGAFDPALQFGEDEEANYRLRRSGFQIMFHPGMKFYYHVRPSFVALFRQYYNYGAARVKVLRKHPRFFRIKHLVPSGITVALTTGVFMPLIPEPLLVTVVATISLYVLFITYGALCIGIKKRFFYFHYIAASLLMLHLGYGAGMIREICRITGRVHRRVLNASRVSS